MTDEREAELLAQIRSLETTVAQLEEVIMNHSVAMLNQIGMSGQEADEKVYGPRRI